MDRPAQFAGMRTSTNLQPLGDGSNLYCQPAADYLPDPQACLIHGITPQYCYQNGQAEAAFANAIEQLLTVPGTISIGYNSMKFDELVTRFLFWRNLIDPYAHTWSNRCARWDLLNAVRAAWALRPSSLNWPRDEDGRVSLKLERLTEANGIAHGKAHNAEADVAATIELARLLRQNAPRLFEFCLLLHKKSAVCKQIGWPYSGEPRPFLHVSGMYGTALRYMAIVWPLAELPGRKNELIVWDLRHSPVELADLSADEIRKRLFTKSDNLSPGEERLPIKTIHLNQSPVVVAQLKTLPEAEAIDADIDREQIDAHTCQAVELQRKLSDRELWTQVYKQTQSTEALTNEEDKTDVDRALYQGFLPNEDKKTLAELRGCPPHDLVNRRPSFTDGRLEELFFRYRARNFSDSLQAPESTRWKDLRISRLQHGTGGSRTIAACKDSLEKMFDAATEDGDAHAQEILDALATYVDELSAPLQASPTHETGAQ